MKMTVYLVVLNFRTPPFQTIFSQPNILKDTLITLDRFFSFAQNYTEGDWRCKYLIDLTRDVVDKIPNIKASYLMPSIRKNKTLLVYTPYNTELIFDLKDSVAYLLHINNKVKKILGGSIKICISKRSTISKVLSIEKSIGIKISGALGKIEERRGAYRDIFYEVQISRTNLLWSAITKGNINDIKKFMKIALKTGIGKKRNMGWGDLKNFCVYEIKNRDGIHLNEEKVIYRDKQYEYCEFLRPHATSDVISILRNNYTLLECNLTHGDVNPPYWKKRLVISLARFVRVL